LKEILFSRWSTIIVNTFPGIKTKALEFKIAPLQDYIHKTPNYCLCNSGLNNQIKIVILFRIKWKIYYLNKVGWK
jgi:hypothetical protein